MQAAQVSEDAGLRIKRIKDVSLIQVRVSILESGNKTGFDLRWGAEARGDGHFGDCYIEDQEVASITFEHEESARNVKSNNQAVSEQSESDRAEYTHKIYLINCAWSLEFRRRVMLPVLSVAGAALMPR